MEASQRASFEELGFVRVAGAFSRADAAAMEQRVWSWLERKYGVVRSDPSTWLVPSPTGLQGLKAQAVFDAIGSDTLCAALDDLIGAGRWQRPRDWGGFLVNFPTGSDWKLPSRVWHTDFDFRGPPTPLVGALALSFLSDVPAGAGGTLAVAGSHRLIADFVAARPSAGREKMKVTRTALMASDPWLRELGGADDAPGRTERFMGRDTLVRGIPVRVVELSGEAGDVVITHPWLLHAGAPNCGAAPRLMRVQRVRLAASAVSVASAM
jgi:hypothetical protein